MLTIFSTPRPFVGPFAVIQRNAIASWLALRPECQVVLFDDEEHTTQAVAAELGVLCVTDGGTNEFGTLLINDVLARARTLARYDVLAQVNSDIILLSDFVDAVGRVRRSLAGSFLMVGRRWDLDLRERIDTGAPHWEERLRVLVAREGRRHGMSGLDYWVFPRSLEWEIPPFVVGRPGMDSWLVYAARSRRVPVVDATAAVTCIHQSHHYPRRAAHYFAIERQRNIDLAGGYGRLGNLLDADWRLTNQGLSRIPYPRRILTDLTLFGPWRYVLGMKRKLQAVR